MRLVTADVHDNSQKGSVCSLAETPHKSRHPEVWRKDTVKGEQDRVSVSQVVHRRHVHGPQSQGATLHSSPELGLLLGLKTEQSSTIARSSVLVQNLSVQKLGED